ARRSLNGTTQTFAGGGVRPKYHPLSPASTAIVSIAAMPMAQLRRMRIGEIRRCDEVFDFFRYSTTRSLAACLAGSDGGVAIIMVSARSRPSVARYSRSQRWQEVRWRVNSASSAGRISRSRRRLISTLAWRQVLSRLLIRKTLQLKPAAELFSQDPPGFVH